MRQQWDNRADVRVGLNVKIDPRVVLSSQLLSLAQAELDQAIETELMENPALERLEDDFEPITDETILRTLAPSELAPSSENYEFTRSLPNDGGTEVDWLDFAPSHTTLWQHLRAQLLPELDDQLRPIGEYLIECVDERGYLSTTIEEVALALNSSLDEAEAVLRALQRCDPPGVGATSVHECLLLQLRSADTSVGKLAKLIVKKHWDELLHQDMRSIARRYRVQLEDVDAAFQEIRSLSPFPGETFGEERSGSRPVAAAAVSPDLVLTRETNGWTIQVRGADPQSLIVSRSYRDRVVELKHMAHPPQDERRHLTQYVNRAQRFIEALEQRKRTMLRIGEYLVTEQSGFVTTGEYRFLGDLTRTQVASDIGVHESTVSRATMGKFVQIATGEVVPFEVFFKPALRVQHLIAEILATENPDNPLSDERIAALLAERGIKVARRTVNKYRDQGKLLSSRRRHSA